MSNPEFKPGDNVKVEKCDKKPVFCVVSSSTEKRDIPGVPLQTEKCGCIRDPNEIELIPSVLKED